MEERELLPCAHCGGEDAYDLYDDWTNIAPPGSIVTHQIACPECGAMTASYDTEERAIAAWNTRAAVTDERFAYAVHDGHLWKRVDA